MSVAYLIRAHHKPTQLVRLVDRLTTDTASFHIHVDARSPAQTYAAMREELVGHERVRWLPRTVSRYAGFSLVEALLRGLEEIARAEPAPSHTVFLSGQDYPLRSAAEIERTLAGRAGESLVEHFRIPSERWVAENGGLDRIRYWYFEHVQFRTRILRLPLLRRTFPAELEPYGGSAWGAVSREAARTLVEFRGRNPSPYRFFRHVKTPDEIFVQSVLMSSSGAGLIVDESTHYVEWSGSSHPETLGREDFPRIAASGKLFARKFDVDRDAEILDLIDQELLSPPSREGVAPVV